ncbi:MULTISPECIES: hypothetical protein [Pseudomonas aeruginosa group]|uniref:hypothetical protein n=1 Tax=Pseudomonas aeruginosa group TaxID=136841 RepID=UPI00072C5928|nr:MULTISPECIES: hypothetical protein [Pseudomonas aeruginosa group]MCW8021737.1 hypothetical protein [Pseudomonas aeruginosa]
MSSFQGIWVPLARRSAMARSTSSRCRARSTICWMPAPYSIRPSQEALVHFFHGVADDPACR